MCVKSYSNSEMNKIQTVSQICHIALIGLVVLLTMLTIHICVSFDVHFNIILVLLRFLVITLKSVNLVCFFFFLLSVFTARGSPRLMEAHSSPFHTAVNIFYPQTLTSAISLLTVLQDRSPLTSPPDYCQLFSFIPTESSRFPQFQLYASNSCTLTYILVFNMIEVCVCVSVSKGPT